MFNKVIDGIRTQEQQFPQLSSHHHCPLNSRLLPQIPPENEKKSLRKLAINSEEKKKSKKKVFIFHIFAVFLHPDNQRFRTRERAGKKEKIERDRQTDRQRKKMFDVE